MATVYIAVVVPADLLAAATEAVQPALTQPGDVFTVPLVPLAGPDDATPTAWGCSAAVANGGTLYAALTGLPATFPEVQFAVYSPYRTFNLTVWTNWLAGLGLKRRIA
jgi:hypothetical protein